MSGIVVQKIVQLDENEISDLVQEGLQQGYSFMERFKDEYINGANRFDKPGEALYIAKCGDKIVGVCGLNLDPYLNNQKIGRVRHLYVSRAFQKQGLGQSLVSKIIDEADRYYEVLVLRTSNPIADRLYCALGF